MVVKDIPKQDNAHAWATQSDPARRSARARRIYSIAGPLHMATTVRMSLTPLGVSLALVVATACQNSPSGPGAVSDSTFVAAVSDLRLAVTPRATPGIAPAPPDTAALSHARDSILKKYGVTAAALESAAGRLARRPDHAADIFGAIDHRVQTASAQVVPQPGPGNPRPTPAGAAAPPVNSLHPSLPGQAPATNAPGRGPITRPPAAAGQPGLLTRPTQPAGTSVPRTKTPIVPPKARKPSDSL